MQLQNVDVIARFRTRSKREGFVGRGVKVVQAPAQERVLHNGVGAPTASSPPGSPAPHTFKIAYADATGARTVLDRLGGRSLIADARRWAT